MKKYRVLALILCLVMVLSMFCGCSLIGFGSSQNTKADKLLGTVFQYIKDKYADVLTEEELDEVILAGGNAMLGKFDKYGFLLSPKEYYNLMYPTSTSTGGKEYFGFTYGQIKYVGLLVSSVSTDSNSYGGLFAGDIITDIRTIDGQKLTYLDDNGNTKTLNVKVNDTALVQSVLAEYNKLLFTVKRGATEANAYDDGSQFQIVISRGVIDESISKGYDFVEYYFGKKINNVSDKTVTLRNLTAYDDSDVGYIRIKEFGKTYDENQKLVTDTAGEVEKAMKLFKESGKKKLVIDLKSDPGGNVDEVVKVASYFIYDANNTDGQLLVTTMKERENQESYSTKSKFTEYFSADLKQSQIAVFTDSGSASASELLLGAILDYGTGVHLGTTSYGKGIAQYIVPILAGSFTENGQEKKSFYAIYYTAAYYYTPKDLNIHGKGFTPTPENTFEDYAGLTTRAKEILK